MQFQHLATRQHTRDEKESLPWQPCYDLGYAMTSCRLYFHRLFSVKRKGGRLNGLWRNFYEKNVFCFFEMQTRA